MVTFRFRVQDTAPAGASSVTLAEATLNSGAFTTTTEPAPFTVIAPPTEGEGEATLEGEGETPPEGEGEVVHEGEGETVHEGEGEVAPEGEIEGEVVPEGETQQGSESSQEGEGESDTGGFNCNCPPSQKNWPNWSHGLADLMLLGLGMTVLIQFNRGR